MTAAKSLRDLNPLSYSNNLNLLRLIAASAVMFSHAFDLNGEHDWFYVNLKYSGGWVAVSLFFSMSGYLIYNSITRSKNIKAFLVARVVRIFPGLVVMLLTTTFLIGLFITTLPVNDFFLSIVTWNYIARNSVLYAPAYLLPGTFTNNAYPLVINGSLWTLRFEFTCYIFTLLLFMARLFSSSRKFNITVLCLLALYALLIVYFLTAFWAASLKGWFFDRARQIPDISYGVYIYAFPIQQVLAQYYPGWPPIKNAVVGLCLTTIPATLSWYAVEKPALRLKSLVKRPAA